MKNKLIGAAVLLAVAGTGGLLLTTKEHEGLRYSTYIDPVGVPTICYGHTGPDVKRGMTLTKDQCDALFQLDWAKHEAGVLKCTKVPLTANQQWAVTDFAYNLGVSRYCNSTLTKKLNRGDYQGAADEFPRWVYGNVRGKATVLPGLVKRRAFERKVFLTP